MWWILLVVYVVGYVLTTWPVFRLMMQANVHDRVTKGLKPEMDVMGELLFLSGLICLFWPLVLGFFLSHRLWAGTKLGLLQEMLLAEETSRAHDRARTELRRQDKAIQKAYEELDESRASLPPSAAITYDDDKRDTLGKTISTAFQDVRRAKAENAWTRHKAASLKTRRI